MSNLTKALRRARAIAKTVKVDEGTLRKDSAAKSKKSNQNNNRVRKDSAPPQTSARTMAQNGPAKSKKPNQNNNGEAHIGPPQTSGAQAAGWSAS